MFHTSYETSLVLRTEEDRCRLSFNLVYVRQRNGQCQRSVRIRKIDRPSRSCFDKVTFPSQSVAEIFQVLICQILRRATRRSNLDQAKFSLKKREEVSTIVQKNTTKKKKIEIATSTAHGNDEDEAVVYFTSDCCRYDDAGIGPRRLGGRRRRSSLDD